MMFGLASDETDVLMPAYLQRVWLAPSVRKSGEAEYLRP